VWTAYPRLPASDFPIRRPAYKPLLFIDISLSKSQILRTLPDTLL